MMATEVTVVMRFDSEQSLSQLIDQVEQTFDCVVVASSEEEV